mmetsp:Transcript_2052/g.7356  ORF Transcript_2052/g.7356 Transcript_2052/m.7356 type:complete len:301 (-) Transcript_2052:563-1465(-)
MRRFDARIRRFDTCVRRFDARSAAAVRCAARRGRGLPAERVHVVQDAAHQVVHLPERARAARGRRAADHRARHLRDVRQQLLHEADDAGPIRRRPRARRRRASGCVSGSIASAVVAGAARLALALAGGAAPTGAAHLLHPEERVAELRLHLRRVQLRRRGARADDAGRGLRGVAPRAGGVGKVREGAAARIGEGGGEGAARARGGAVAILVVVVVVVRGPLGLPVQGALALRRRRDGVAENGGGQRGAVVEGVQEGLVHVDHVGLRRRLIRRRRRRATRQRDDARREAHAQLAQRPRVAR